MSEGKAPIIVKKIKKISGGHHGGSWKVAYADFVTAMMAFFLLLWLLSMVSPEKKIEISYYFKSFSVFQQRGSGMLEHELVTTRDSTLIPFKAKTDKTSDDFKEEDMKKKNPAADEQDKASEQAPQEKIKMDTSRRNMVLKLIQEKIMKSGLSEEIGIILTQKGLKIHLPSFLFFKEGSAKLDPEKNSMDVLDAIASVLKDLPYAVRLEGHTDDKNPANSEYDSNWDLSGSRAITILKYFEQKGVSPLRMVAEAYGEYRPYRDNKTLVGRKYNRRVEIHLDMTKVMP